MQEIKKKQYDSATRLNAVKRLLNEEITAVELAAELDIDANLLRQWKSRYINEHSHLSKEEAERLSPEEKNIHLQTKVEQLKNDISILKKAFSIMIKES